jgi:hypothetical protein
MLTDIALSGQDTPMGLHPRLYLAALSEQSLI